MTRRVLLVADFPSTGGTRTFLRQLLDFYGRSDVQASLVAPGCRVDASLKEACRSYGHVIVDGPSLDEPVSRAWFRLALRGREFDGLVVSTGTPGRHLSILPRHRPSLYILHTYPHGVRQAALGNLLSGPRIPAKATVVAVSHWQTARMGRRWLRFVDRNLAVVRNVPQLTAAAATPSPRRIPALTVGTVASYKRPGLWLEAAHAWRALCPRDPSAQWTWIGDGPLLPSMKEACSRDGGTTGHFLGELNDPGPWLARADAYVQTSRVENMSFAVLEAMRAGVPCIVSPHGALPEIVEGGRSGIIVTEDAPEAYAQAVQAVRTDVSLRRRLIENAHRTLAERHGRAAWDIDMLRLHERMWSSPGAR